MNKAELSFKLREYRYKNKMLQEDLAAYLGTSPEQVCRWEMCKHKAQDKWIKIMKERGVL